MLAYPPSYTPVPWTNQDLTLYHGTIDVNAASIIQNGPARSARGQSRYNDFGPGFYATTLRRQAEAWAWQRALRLRVSPALVVFTVDRDALANLEMLAFVRGTFDADDFWSFVFRCLNGAANHARGGSSQTYDVVIGPVVASSGQQRLALADFDQVSFHTDSALNLLGASHPSQVNL